MAGGYRVLTFSSEKVVPGGGGGGGGPAGGTVMTAIASAMMAGGGGSSGGGGGYRNVVALTDLRTRSSLYFRWVPSSSKEPKLAKINTSIVLHYSITTINVGNFHVI